MKCPYCKSIHDITYILHEVTEHNEKPALWCQECGKLFTFELVTAEWKTKRTKNPTRIGDEP